MLRRTCDTQSPAPDFPSQCSSPVPALVMPFLTSPHVPEIIPSVICRSSQRDVCSLVQKYINVTKSALMEPGGEMEIGPRKNVEIEYLENDYYTVAFSLISQ